MGKLFDECFLDEPSAAIAVRNRRQLTGPEI